MKKGILILSIMITSMSYARAADHTVGFGFMLGDPMGLNAKLNIVRMTSVEIGLGDAGGDGYYAYGDLLLNIYAFQRVPNLYFFVGVGLGYHDYEKDNNRNDENKDENRYEVRVPFGVEYVFEEVPIGVFLEAVPALQFSPDVDSEFRAVLGARYYF